MRSPIIAFSLFAAVSPSLVSAAPTPQSPRLGNDVMGHSMPTDLKYPHRFAFPRNDNAVSKLLGGVSAGGTSTSSAQSPSDGDSQGKTHHPSGLTPAGDASLPGDAAVDTASGTGSKPPAEPKPPAMPPVRTGSNYTPNVPVPGGDGPRPNTGSSDDSSSSSDTL